MNSDFKDLLAALHQASVEYLVVGGYAAIHYSQPRYTKDLDIWIRPDPENAARVMKAFHAFGLSTLGLEESDFATEGTQLNIGVPPTSVDILTTVPGLRFEDVWDRREESDEEGNPVLYLSKEDLIAAKKFAGRPVDLADIEEIERNGDENE